MARTPLDTIELGLPRRAGAQYELDALAPFPLRARFGAWQFDRLPYARHLLYAGGARHALLTRAQTQQQLSAIERGLGSTIGNLQPVNRGIVSGTLGAARPEMNVLPDSIYGSEIAHQDSYLLTIDNKADQLQSLAVTTPVIPYASTIVAINESVVSAGGSTDQIALLEVDVDYNGIFDTVTGVPILQLVNNLGAVPGTFVDGVVIGPVVRSELSNGTWNNLFASAIGQTIKAGKRIALVHRLQPASGFGNAILDQVLITVREILPATRVGPLTAGELGAIAAPAFQGELATAPGPEAVAANAASDNALVLLREKNAAAAAALTEKNRTLIELARVRATAEHAAALDAAARDAAAAAATAAAARAAADAATAARAQAAAIAAQSQSTKNDQAAATARALASATIARAAAQPVTGRVTYTLLYGFNAPQYYTLPRGERNVIIGATVVSPNVQWLPGSGPIAIGAGLTSGIVPYSPGS